MEYVTDKNLREFADELIKEFDPYAYDVCGEFDEKEKAELRESLIPILRKYLYLVAGEARTEGKQQTVNGMG